MGAGVHGGFGSTRGAKYSEVVTADSSLVGNGHGKELAIVAKRVKKEPGYTDVAIHGSPNSVSVFRKTATGEEEIILDQRRLAKYLKHDKGYSGGKIRLLSCKTGIETGTFAQNLANKMGVVVRAPSDTLHIYPNGKMVIGPDKYTNSGHWIDYYPRGRKKR
ncbi:MAG: hypothetical protein IJH82_04015 [Lachnospiraceae bacterium]|nr:hypothetical protein [Lachnospiraceae bacterium]